MATTTTLPLPTFLIIGAQKSATRWLRYNLGLHPQIFTATEELWFFNNVAHRFADRGVSWYRQQFEGWDGEPFVGEATPGYMVLRHDPMSIVRRIEAVVPDVRLIALLRNPVDRAKSAMVHQMKRGRLPDDAHLIDLVTDPTPEVERMGLIKGGLYAASLRPFLERFGDQLQVLLHDDVRTDARGVYTAACHHIGAATDFVPADLEVVRESNQQGQVPVASLSDDERVALFEHFRDDVAQLEGLIGRDLSMWDPSATAPRAAAS